ncbi:ABC transporter substrate-binding protein [Protofrankia symbiont of Coriaria ruscifolia]|uniref:ABC transporter substrate-binding protein n=1 Tax=Protofrankia symbiont of Coriaria ruscifolia TaxID=1306542 RepID=UPI001040E932|nr:ABC transporter substrate-binding protein [Protofrankia symbiont of Coriaria ruscifolia]
MGNRSCVHRLLTAAILVVGLVMAVSGCGSSTTTSGETPRRSFTLRVGFISTGSNLGGPEGWAKNNGSLVTALTPAGVTNIEWVSFDNGPKLAAAMLGGSVDVGILGDTPALVARAAGLDARLVNQTRINLDTWLFAQKSGGPTSIKDLAGRTVATQVGSYMYRYLLDVLNQAGIRDKVTVSNLYTPNAQAALVRGDIAAYAAPAQIGPRLAAEGIPVIDKASVSHHDLYGTSVTIATEKLIAAHPDLPAVWNKARAAAVIDITAHPDAYYAFDAGVLGLSAAEAREIDPLGSYSAQPFTTEGLALLTSTARFLSAEKLAKNTVDVSSWQLTSPS